MTQKEKDFIDFLDRHPPLLFLFIFLLPFFLLLKNSSSLLRLFCKVAKKPRKENITHDTCYFF